MKVNYHTHTQFCKHANGLPDEYVQEALKNNLTELGFSDHAPFKDIDYGYRMEYKELSQYCEYVDKAKEKYSDKIKILKALEIEFLPQYTQGTNYYEELFTKNHMDYLVLGEHFFCTKDGSIQNITSIKTPEIVLDYAKSCAQAMKTGYFKILAHPDLFCINDFSWNGFYDKACDIIIEESLKTGVILEYNANGYRRGIKQFCDGKRYQYPHKNFWQKVKESGAKCIVGSDAHEPKVLWDNNMQNAIKDLQKLNCNIKASLKTQHS